MRNPNRNGRCVLVFSESGKWGTPNFNSDLFSTGRNIADSLEGTLCAALLGSNLTDFCEETASFAEEVYCIEHPLLDHFQADFYATALEQLCASIKVDVIITGHNSNNVDVMTRLSFRLGGDILTDCVKFEMDTESDCALCTKPVYGAKALATFELNRKPYVVTMRSNPIQPTESNLTNGKVIHFNPNLDESMTEVKLIQRVEEDYVDLETADAIVCGGRGVNQLELLKDLSGAMERFFTKVEIGGSRPLIDARLLPSTRQIGLTGKKVAPRAYFAVGVSGSLQHVTGILGSRRIIAINSDPEAPIFRYADYGLIGKCEEATPSLIQKMEELS